MTSEDERRRCYVVRTTLEKHRRQVDPPVPVCSVMSHKRTSFGGSNAFFQSSLGPSLVPAPAASPSSRDFLRAIKAFSVAQPCFWAASPSHSSWVHRSSSSSSNHGGKTRFLDNTPHSTQCHNPCVALADHPYFLPFPFPPQLSRPLQLKLATAHLASTAQPISFIASGGIISLRVRPFSPHLPLI
jgi:hypothetical protein